MDTIVTKFGGSSLADANQFKKVKDIVLADPNRRFVVASAPGKRFPEDIKVTDLLLKCYSLASRGDDFDQPLQAIRKRFTEIVEALGIEFDVDREISILRVHLSCEPSEAYVASRGEYLNSRILAKYLGFTFVDPAWCISFNEDGTLNLKMTMRTMKAALYPVEKAVIAGFYGADTEDVIHTFSRGGSDVTGSLVALAVDAKLYENWTDVSGLLAADPRIVENPRSVRYISTRELRTLSYMGASVLHTDAVLPASGADIPINIRNTNKPEDPGTMIVRKLPKEVKRHAITGMAGRTGMSVIQIEKVMVSDGAGFSAIMLDLLKRRNIPFEQCLTGIDTVTLVIKSSVLESCKEELLAEINEVLAPDFIGIKENLSMIAVVGEKGTEASDANIRVLQALANADIEISTINQGAGKLNLLIGVPEAAYEKAIKAIYETVG
ncbi:MAG: aspartate kinase [Lachnospiraceae bacterium]|nr:aspartate kinase [Candidatus Equihabitans merdae]